jgi:hypothetical protein
MINGIYDFIPLCYDLISRCLRLQSGQQTLFIKTPPPQKHPPGIISTPKIGTPPNENRVFFDFFDKKKVLARLNAPYKSMCDLYQKAFWFCENFSIFLARGAIRRPFFHFFRKNTFVFKTLFFDIFGGGVKNRHFSRFSHFLHIL